MIVSAGECLIDLTERHAAGANPVLEALPGGSPWNTALALGRLGAPAGYLGPISADRFGRLLRRRLEEAGTRPLLADESPRPTALAVVGTGASGDAVYSFYRTGTADRDVDRQAMLSALPGDLAVYHTGSLALADEPEAEVWAEAAAAAADGGALLSLDPNVRPRFIDNDARYRDRLALLLDRAALVKLSEEDLGHLMVEPELGAVRRLFFEQHGCALVALTRGARGATLLTERAEAWVEPHPPARLVDTIGAGDTFSAALLVQLHEFGCRDAGALAALSAEQLATAGRFAAAAAGLVCGRQGCDPPSRAEVEAEMAGRPLDRGTAP